VGRPDFVRPLALLSPGSSFARREVKIDLVTSLYESEGIVAPLLTKLRIIHIFALAPEEASHG
jgi:hypothetical protein